MTMFRAALQTVKYSAIILYSTIRCKTCVDFFGSSYIVYGNVVHKVRGKK